MIYSTALSKPKALLMTFTGIVVFAGALFLLRVLYENDFGFSRGLLLLWILLPLLLLISLLLVYASIALLFTFKGNVIEMHPLHLTVQLKPFGTIELPWSAIEKIGLAGAGATKSLVFTLNEPERYLPALTPPQQRNVKLRTSQYGTPFVIVLRFLDRPAQEIYDKAIACWNHSDTEQA